MKKLTLAVLISGAMSTAAFADDHMNKDHDMKKVQHTFTTIDSNQDGMLGKEEVSDHAISKHFDKFDTNGDKQLSENEYITYMQDNPKAFSDDVKEDVQFTKAKVTADADEVLASSPKKLKTDETQVGAQMSSEGGQMNSMNQNAETVKRKTESAMSSDENMQGYDADSDADLRNNEEMSGNEGDRMVAQNEFKMMDKNGDGMVSEEEASQAGVNNTFDDMDENGDSMISRKEYREFRQSEEVSR